MEARHDEILFKLRQQTDSMYSNLIIGLNTLVRDVKEEAAQRNSNGELKNVSQYVFPPITSQDVGMKAVLASRRHMEKVLTSTLIMRI